MRYEDVDVAEALDLVFTLPAGNLTRPAVQKAESLKHSKQQAEHARRVIKETKWIEV